MSTPHIHQTTSSKVITTACIMLVVLLALACAIAWAECSKGKCEAFGDDLSAALRNYSLIVIAGIGLLFAYMRLGPLNTQARTAQLDSVRHLFRDAADDLTSDSLVKRVAALGVLRRLSVDHDNRFFDAETFALLNSFVQEQSKPSWPSWPYGPSEGREPLPEDVQIAVEMIRERTIAIGSRSRAG